MSELDTSTRNLQDDYDKKKKAAAAAAAAHATTAKDLTPGSTFHPKLTRDMTDAINSGLFAMAFMVAILCGGGIGLGLIFKYKLCILVAIMFILLTIVSPQFSDYLVYGIGEYVELGYSALKKSAGLIFRDEKKEKNKL